MEAPNADPDSGPMIILESDIADAESTVDQVYDEYKQGMAEDEENPAQLTNKHSITIGGLTGIAADLSVNIYGQQVSGRFVVVKVTSTRIFVMIGGAPSELWGELDPLFDAVVDSVTFFEPTQ